VAPVYKLSASSIKGRTNYGSMLAGNTAFALTYFESIATVSVGSGGAANVEFTSIPATFTHLQIRYTCRSTAASVGQYDPVLIRFNSDTATNYSYHYLTGTGSAVNVSGGANSSSIFGGLFGYGNTNSAFNAAVTDILDYTNTSKYKTVRTLSGVDNNGSGEVFFDSGSWRNTNAITQILLYPPSGNFTEYSSFALYGIKGAV
jgi:hypothetical protein